MEKSLLDNGNIKSESPKESNAVTTCGCQDTSYKESEKNSVAQLNSNQNQFWEIGMDLVATLTFPLLRPEGKEGYNISSTTTCL